jgi:hypothetical protein
MRVESQRRPWQVDLAEGRMIDFEQESLGFCLVPFVYPVQRAHLPGRDSGLVQVAQERNDVPVSECVVDELDQGLPMLDPRRVVGEKRVCRVNTDKRGK